jgi:uncharacterized membrane protein YdjX (TVP38/TMEM64 family)
VWANDWVQSFNGWIQAFGVWGVVIFGLVYIIAVIVLAPAGPMTIAAGLAFGAWGFPLVVIAATIGAALAFLVSRYLAREKVKHLVENRPKFKAVGKAVTEDGWKIVGLLRLSPLVPFNLQNYAFGVTEIGFLPYVVATFVGIMPGTALYIYLGVLGKAAASGQGGDAVRWVFFAIGLVATAIVAFIITRKAKASLKEAGVGKKEK